MNIGLDLDDTLLDLVPDLVGFYNDENKTDFQKSHFSSYDLTQTWGGKIEDTLDLIKRFYKSDAFTDLKPIFGAIEFVRSSKSMGHKMWVITSRPEFTEVATTSNIKKVFGKVFEDIIFLNHFYGNYPKKTKGEVCDELNIELFADDHLKHCISANNSGRKVYLVNSPWNIDKEVPKGIERINFLSEINLTI